MKLLCTNRKCYKAIQRYEQNNDMGISLCMASFGLYGYLTWFAIFAFSIIDVSLSCFQDRCESATVNVHQYTSQSKQTAQENNMNGVVIFSDLASTGRLQKVLLQVLRRRKEVSRIKRLFQVPALKHTLSQRKEWTDLTGNLLHDNDGSANDAVAPAPFRENPPSIGRLQDALRMKHTYYRPAPGNKEPEWENYTAIPVVELIYKKKHPLDEAVSKALPSAAPFNIADILGAWASIFRLQNLFNAPPTVLPAEPEDEPSKEENYITAVATAVPHDDSKENNTSLSLPPFQIDVPLISRNIARQQLRPDNILAEKELHFFEPINEANLLHDFEVPNDAPSVYRLHENPVPLRNFLQGPVTGNKLPAAKLIPLNERNLVDNIAQARYLIPAAPSAKYELLQDRYEGSLGYKLNENSHQLAVEPSGSIVSMFNDDKAQELKYILLMLSVCMILLTVVLYTVLFYLMIELSICCMMSCLICPF
ncbi:uncharacterized protein LOC111250168 isoform X2 [Varroa destructor]|uniref:Uncharacterized protein n=1 Tax=Varroa destructor TaxID=109461 RepID=A0A7M7K2N4_VARDE|nr:uncharacterized protein LOC111250168 isoform X2 [Varroa destructor]